MRKTVSSVSRVIKTNIKTRKDRPAAKHAMKENLPIALERLPVTTVLRVRI